MPLLKRKRSILEPIRDIALTPFILVIFGIFNARWILLFASVLVVFCYFLDPQQFRFRIPNQEDVVICLLFYFIVVVVATPLALRDYLSDGGYEITWQADEAYENYGRDVAHLLIAEEFALFRDSFTDELRAQHSIESLISMFRDYGENVARRESLQGVEELEFRPTKSEKRKLDPRINALVAVYFQCTDRNLIHILELYLTFDAGFRIAQFKMTTERNSFEPLKLKLKDDE